MSARRAPVMLSEDRLCLALARGRLTPAPREAAASLLARPLDWAVVLERLHAHGVVPLACRSLAALGWRGVPPDVRRALEAGGRVNALRNELLMSDLTSVLRLLHAAGIPAIPLKGPVLAEALYGDTGCRTCSDLDLLVPRSDVRHAWPLLGAAGWRPAEAYRVEPRDLDWLVESNIEYAFVRRRGEFATPLELHWDMTWRWQRDGGGMAGLWSAARPTQVGGVPCMTLADPWQIVYLATHAARHRWQGLKWIADIHELASRETLDWDEVDRIGGELRLTQVVRISLAVSQALLGTVVPPGHGLGALPPWLRIHPAASATPSIWRDALLPLRVMEGAAARLGYLARVLLRPTLAERRLLRLPARLEPLYWALRPLRLGCRFTSDVARAGVRRLATVAS